MARYECVRLSSDEYLSKMNKDPFYRLTANIQDASEDETTEILNEIEIFSDDDLSIDRINSFQI